MLSRKLRRSLSKKLRESRSKKSRRSLSKKLRKSRSKKSQKSRSKKSRKSRSKKSRSRNKKYHGLLGSWADSASEKAIRKAVEVDMVANSKYEKLTDEELFLRQINYLYNLTGQAAKDGDTVLSDIVDKFENDSTGVEMLISKLKRSDPSIITVLGMANAQRLLTQLNTTWKQAKRAVGSVTSSAGSVLSAVGSVGSSVFKTATGIIF